MDLTARYLGLALKNPLVASASPLSRTLDGIRKLDDAGIGAVVLYSLFQEQIAWSDRPRPAGAATLQQAPGYLPNWETESVGPDEYLDLVSLAKRAVRVPLIASLNGSAGGDWTRYAALIEEAGADALELNLSFVPTDASLTAAEVEKRYLDAVREVCQTVTFPVAVKIGPYFSALPAMARQLTEAGADGLVLFNRYYAPDFDIACGSVSTQRVALSGSDDLRLPLRWTALLYGTLNADLALSGGVHTSEDVLKALMGGANVAMLTSELLQNGLGRVAEITGELARWLQTHGFAAASDIRGVLSAQRRRTEPGFTERAGYINTIRSLRPEGTIAGHLVS